MLNYCQIEQVPHSLRVHTQTFTHVYFYLFIFSFCYIFCSCQRSNRLIGAHGNRRSARRAASRPRFYLSRACRRRGAKGVTVRRGERHCYIKARITEIFSREGEGDEEVSTKRALSQRGDVKNALPWWKGASVQYIGTRATVEVACFG